MGVSNVIAGPKEDLTRNTNVDNAKIIAKGISISFVGRIAYNGLTYLFSVVIARSIGASSFGLFSLVLAVVTLARLLSLAGLDRGALRYIARLRTVGNEKDELILVYQLFLIVAGSGLIVAIFIALFADPLASLYKQNSPDLAYLLRLFSPAIPISALLFLFTAVSDGQKRVEYGVITRETLQPLSNIILAFFIILVGGGLAGIVIGYSFSMGIALALQIFLLRDYFRDIWSAIISVFDTSLIREVVSFSLPFLPLMFVRQVGNRLEVYLLGFLGSPEDVGIFGAAASTALLTTFGLQAVVSIYSAISAELHAKNNLAQLEYVLQLASRWSTAVSIPAIIVIVMFNNDILNFFGEEFSTGSTVLIVLAVGQLINAATGPVGITLNMAGYSRLGLVNNVMALILNVVVDWWLILKWGILGAAIGSTMVMIILNLAVMLEVSILLKIRSYGHNLWRPVLAGAITFVFIWLVNSLPLTLNSFMHVLSGSILIVVIYCLLLIILSTRDDRELFSAAWAKIKSISPWHLQSGDKKV